jgi:hypothetical protein
LEVKPEDIPIISSYLWMHVNKASSCPMVALTKRIPSAKKRVAAHNNGMILLCAYYSPCSSRTTEVKNAL